MRRRTFLVQSAATAVLVPVGFACQPAAQRRRRPEDVRDIEAVVPAQASRDGAGVNLHRALGHRGLSYLDPFLLLDEIRSTRREDWEAGFPTHPHRGFETVSYLLSGAFEHRDSVGNRGLIGPGDCQWMTAGRGIVHSEMPRQDDGKELFGLQLWVNLPAAQKMTMPRYQDMPASDIPELDMADARVRVVTGSVGKVAGPVDGIAVSPTMLDVSLEHGALFRHELPSDDTCFVYVLEGKAEFGPRAVPVRQGELAVLGKGRDVMASSDAGARFLLLAATPIGEPVARRGPFVMNTKSELDQAFEDFRTGRLVTPQAAL